LGITKLIGGRVRGARYGQSKFKGAAGEKSGSANAGKGRKGERKPWPPRVGKRGAADTKTLWSKKYPGRVSLEPDVGE